MSEINRDVSSLRKTLEQLARDGNGWWSDVLSCENLMLAVRGGYLNAYTNGQSIFQIAPGTGGGPPVAYIHYKYLLRPKSKNPYVRFDGKKFDLDAKSYIQTEYRSGETLRELIAAADRYSGAEKRGVHAIAQGNDNVLDVEIAFRAPRKLRAGRGGAGIVDSRREPDEISTHRIDLAAIHPSPAGAQIIFYEAKCASNAELWRIADESAGKEIEVVSQVLGYEAFLKRENVALVKAYTEVCRTFAWLSEQGWVKKCNPLVSQVAKGKVELSIHPKVYLLVFDFDAATRENSLREQLKKIEEKLPSRIIDKGNPKHFRLLNDVEKRERTKS
jgi:hypothetical protein